MRCAATILAAEALARTRGPARSLPVARWLACLLVAATMGGCGQPARQRRSALPAVPLATRSPERPARSRVVALVARSLGGNGAAPATRHARARRPLVGNARLRIPVVMYHVIAAPPRSPYAYLYVTRRRFARQMAALRAAGYCAITLRTAHALWAGDRRLPACHPLLVRFDDGYTSVFDQAFPVLRRMGWPANLCQQVQRIDFPGGLTADQIRTLLAHGWDLADHGYYQPELSLIGASPAQLRRQVAGSRRRLAARFGVQVHYYCWPLGYYDTRAIRAARAAGFQGGLGVGLGVAEPARQGRWRLDAIPVWGALSTSGLVAEVRRLQSQPSPLPPAAHRS